MMLHPTHELEPPANPARFNPAVVSAMESWWSEYLSGSRRDQISLPFALRQSGVAFGLLDENVRDNGWVKWRPHFKVEETKRRLAAYSQAGAVILHAPGAEIRLRRLLMGPPKGQETLRDQLLCRVFGPPPDDILFDDNILGIAPHGAPAIDIVGHDLLMNKPVALLCDDPTLHDPHAASVAKDRGAQFETDAEIPGSPVYGTARRIAFEHGVQTFLASHPGPKAILHNTSLAQRDRAELARWPRAQGRNSLAWKVKFAR